MFLEHHNFNSTVKQFKTECQTLGYSQVQDAQNPSERSVKTPTKTEIICPKCKHLIGISKKSTKKTVVAIEAEKTSVNRNESTKGKLGKVHFKKGKTMVQNKDEDLDVLKNKLSNLEDEHQKLTEVTMELTMALQKSIRGQTDNMNIIMNNCKKIYPELFHVQTEETNGNVSKAEMTTKHVENSPAIEQIDFLISNPDGHKYSTYFELDYRKIEDDLRNADEKTKLLLLQALRWRLTKSLDSIRTHVIKNYSRNDLLQLTNDLEIIPALLEKLFQSTRSADPVQQAVAQLVNTLSSLKLGRDYLTHHSKLSSLLVQVLTRKKLDHFTRDMVIAALQKLSLRYSQRINMIKNGVVEHMVSFLHENYKLVSMYCLEYSSALLMNLWLHNEARDKCKPSAVRVIKLLANLLDVNFKTCLPFVNGALYNLLADSYFNQAARNVNLLSFVTSRLAKAEGEMREQLQYLGEILNDPKAWKPNTEHNFGLETDREMDILEPELDEDDLARGTEINGEEFLYKYRLVFSSNGPQVPTTTSKPEVLHQELPEKSFQLSSKNPSLGQLKDVQNFKPETSQSEIENDRNNNREKQIYLVRELAFCEDVEQYFHKSRKDALFEHSRRTSLPFLDRTFTVKDLANSLPTTPTVLAIMDVENDATVDSNKSQSSCKENMPASSVSSSYTSESEYRNKYSCICYDILKNSVDEDRVEFNHEGYNRNCKYNNVCSDSCKLTAPRSQHPKKPERDSGRSSGKLNECDYDSVFESRPKIPRTP